MPVIVIGADTTTGLGITEKLLTTAGEVRAFVTDPAAAGALKARGVKAALGDVSDASHVAGAAAGCFAAVLVTEAACDARERAFAADSASVLAGWTAALEASSVRRAIWVAGAEATPPKESRPEHAVVPTEGRPIADVVAEVARLEGAAGIP